MARDHLGTVKTRLGIDRMVYRIDPGLYALGNPDDKSPVLVTANYKLSFDSLRAPLHGLQAWILVLDTDGVNVWCAAGKGSFSSEEIVRRIQSSDLTKTVSHRRLIVPQLGAPGVARHEVKAMSGFHVIYGPVNARDLPAFIESGFKATPDMRLKTFSLWERLEVVPVELVGALKIAMIVSPMVLLTGGLVDAGGFWNNLMTHGLSAVVALTAGIISGTVLTPLFLPWLPGRSFALKGFMSGFIVWFFLVSLWGVSSANSFPDTEKIAWLLAITGISGYFAMNFTGSSTYTSLSGVKKEMRWAVPVEISTVALGLMLWIYSLSMI